MRSSNLHSATPRRTEYLSFQLGGLEYGVDFCKVKELGSLMTLGRVRASGAVLGGVAMSRGVIMPIVDMRAGVHQPGTAKAAETDVIILELSDCVVGIVVDGVTDVVKVEAADIRPLTHANGAQRSDYLLGLAETDGRRLILVDIDRLMSISGASVGHAAA